MRTPRVALVRAIVELTLAGAAAVGSAVSWGRVRYPVLVAPVTDGEPATTSMAYHPPMLLLVWVLATAAGVLAVVGAARLHRLRRRRKAAW